MTSSNVQKHASLLTQTERRQSLGQKGAILWLTGLSGSGKSTIAMALEKALVQEGVWATVLDGDNVRHGLCGDLGFSAADRGENLRRIGEVAGLFYEADLVTICAFVSPNAADRQAIRSKFPASQFAEVYVATPLDTCEARDPKGIYKKARAGQIKNMTGLDAPYDPPECPEYTFNTAEIELDDIVQTLIHACRSMTEV